MARLLASMLMAGAAGLVAADPGFVLYSDLGGMPYSVTYDKRSLFINGERSMLLSAGFHYPRFTPAQWDDIFVKAKNDGFNMIQVTISIGNGCMQ